MKRMYPLNKINFEKIYDQENCSVNAIEKKSGVDHKALNKLIDEVHPVISEATIEKLSKAYGMKKYDLIQDSSMVQHGLS